MSSPRRSDSPVWPGGPSLQGPHRVGAFALCPQLEGFAHDMHLRPIIEKLPAAVGTLVHAGLAYRYASMLPVKPKWYVYADGYEAIMVLGDRRHDFRDLALTMFDTYQRHYIVNIWTPVLVEHQFVVTMPSGEPYSCRTDLLAIEDADHVIVDHKTCGRMSPSIGGRYASDRQMLTNLAIARACGFDVKRVIINAISRENPPQCRRFVVPINTLAFGNLGRDTDYYLRQMAETRKMYPDPANRPRNTEACVTRWGPCDYQPLCTGAGSMNEYMVPEEYLIGRQSKGE